MKTDTESIRHCILLGSFGSDVASIFKLLTANMNDLFTGSIAEFDDQCATEYRSPMAALTWDRLFLL
jgi:hypothetical protein